MSRRSPEPYVQWKVTIPATIAAQVEMIYFDPTLQKPKYAERSRLITELLTKWLEERKMK